MRLPWRGAPVLVRREDEASLKRIGVALAAALATLLACAAPAAADTATFNFTGAEQSFTVPAGVSSVDVIAIGGHGADRLGVSGGRGASVSGTVAVLPGQVLFVEVGGSGADATPNGVGGFNGGVGGFNGGGAGGSLANGGGGGGGASDVRTVPMGAGATSLNSRAIVAGAGGGAGQQAGGDAGSDGDSGLDGGKAGTQTAGGAAGGAGNPGTAGTLGAGGTGGRSGGGGGGGLFGGGGGGAAGGFDGGGGGGSSLVPGGGTSSLAAITTAPQVQITFTPSGGGGGGGGGGPTPDTKAPNVTGYRLSASTFIAANIGDSIAAAKKPPVGTNVSYTLSEPATVKFTVEQAAKGRKVKGKCVKSTRSNRKKPKCTRYKPLKGSFTHAGNQGKNSFKFSGRLNGKKLKPGKYRLVGTATDAAGNVSKSTSVKFKIVKR